MARDASQHRREMYFQLSSQLAQMDNSQLYALFDAGELPAGWGRHHTIEIGGSKIFVKRVPMTATEQNNMFSTKNLYDLPVYYHYGVGSAGFGVFRELVAHIKTTNWVLNGEMETFPLLYHYRIIPLSGERAEMDPEEHRQYVAYWGGNENIGRYMLDRVNASYELVLFLEHIPHVLQSWLLEHLDQVHWVLDDLRATIDFLRKNGVLHLDAHSWNVLTDGEHVYLTDFGLLLDRNFSLREDEKTFFDTHVYYDYGQLLSNLIFPIHDMYMALPAFAQHEVREKYGVPAEGNQFHKLLQILLENIEEIQSSGVIKVDERYLDCLLRYRRIIALMGGFFWEMRWNHLKDTIFPHEELRRLLKETGFIADVDSER